MNIKVIDSAGESVHEVEEAHNGFKSTNFPPPMLGRKYFLGSREVDIKELGMKVEDNRAMYYYSYRIAG